MKTTMICALMSIFASMTVNAENEELSNTAAESEMTTQEIVMNTPDEAVMNTPDDAVMNTSDEAVMTTPEAEQTAEAKPVENGLMLQYPNLIAESNVESIMSSKGDQSFRRDRYWKRARNLRNIGMATTLLGIVGSPLWLVLSSSEAEDVNTVSDGLRAANHTLQYAVIGGSVIVGGMILWIIGNHNMRSARLSYTGNGVAYNF